MNHNLKPLSKHKRFKSFMKVHRKNAKVISRVFNLMTHLILNVNLSKDRQHSESLLVSMKSIQKDTFESQDYPSKDA